MQVKLSMSTVKKFGISPVLATKTTVEIQHLIDSYQRQIEVFEAKSYKLGEYGDLSSRWLDGRYVKPSIILKEKIEELSKAQKQLKQLKAAIREAQES